MLKRIQNNKKVFESIFYAFLLKGQQNGEIPKSKNIKNISSLFYTFYNGLKVVAKVETDPNELIKSVDEMLMIQNLATRMVPCHVLKGWGVFHLSQACCSFNNKPLKQCLH